MENRILAFMHDMETNNAELVAPWFTEESIVWIPPLKPVTGERRIRALFRAMFSRYEYIRWEVLEILEVSENRCIHICTSIGKIRGQEEYKNQVITDIIFNDEGKIISLSDYFKDTAVFSRS